MILAIILVAAAPLGRMTKDNIDKSVEDNVANAFEEPAGIPDIARITGRITDKNNEYVGDYAVYLLGEDGSITETKTDKNGRYTTEKYIGTREQCETFAEDYKIRNL